MTIDRLNLHIYKWYPTAGRALSASLHHLSLSFAIFAAAIAWKWIHDPQAVWLVAAGIGLIIALQLRVLSSQKRLSTVIQASGSFAVESDYGVRHAMWTREKATLTGHLARRVIPKVVRELQIQKPNLRRLVIIIDSGSTLEGLPSTLAASGVGAPNRGRVEILTNSISGINALEKRSPDQKSHARLKDDRFELLGGILRPEYMATTGGNQPATLEAVFAEKRKAPDEVAIIAVATGNWVLAGIGLDRLQVCARGEGHLDFKRAIISDADRTLIVAPLAKILRMDSVLPLNLVARQVGRPADYETWEVPCGLQAKPLLVTTRRSHCPLSPLHGHFEAMAEAQRSKRTKNFELDFDSPHFSPDRHNAAEIRQEEFADPMLAQGFRTLYSLSE